MADALKETPAAFMDPPGHLRPEAYNFLGFRFRV